MKTKVLILLAVSAVITLSFTFASVSSDSKNNKKEIVKEQSDKEPIGGFMSEDKI
jgi:hypothetical protein